MLLRLVLELRVDGKFLRNNRDHPVLVGHKGVIDFFRYLDHRG